MLVAYGTKISQHNNQIEVVTLDPNNPLTLSWEDRILFCRLFFTIRLIINSIHIVFNPFNSTGLDQARCTIDK